MTDLTRLAKKIWDKIPLCKHSRTVADIESLLREAMDAHLKEYIDGKYPGVDDPELNALFRSMRDKMGWVLEHVRKEAYIRAAEVARKFEFECGCDEGEKIAAAIEKLAKEG